MTGSAVGVGLLLEIPALDAYSWSLKLSPNLSLACAPLGTHMADDQEPNLRLPPSMRGHLELVTDGRKQSWVQLRPREKGIERLGPLEALNILCGRKCFQFRPEEGSSLSRENSTWFLQSVLKQEANSPCCAILEARFRNPMVYC